jgi:outer membrane protein assembly factor BamB
VAGVINNLIIVTASCNTQGDGLFAVDKTTHKVVWKQNNADIGSIHVPPSGKYIFTGHEAPSSDADTPITCLDAATGTKVWQIGQKLATVGSAGTDPFAYVDNMLIVGGAKLTALDPATGAVKWATQLGTIDTGGSLANHPFTDGSGRVYVTADDFLVAVDGSNGKLLWQSKLPDGLSFSISSPYAAADGQVYVTDYKRGLYAVDAKSGKCNWSYSNALLAGQDVTTLIAGQQKVYYTAGQAVMGFNANGK